MKFRHLLLLAVLLGIGFVLQQFYLYSAQRDALQVQRAEVMKFSTKIEAAMYQEGELAQQLAEAEQQHSRLRRLLPERLQEKELEQQVATLARKHHIKILATKTATNSRPGYREANIDITLEASVTTANRFMRELKSIPQRIHIIPPENRGKKSIHLSIFIYAVGKEEHKPTTLPRCSDMPQGVLLPQLHERLTLLYEEYSKRCRFVTNYADHYLQQQRLLALKEENTRLAALERALRTRP